MATPKRFTYTPSQLEQYFDRIALPKPHRLSTISHLAPNDKLTFLHRLQKHQLVKVPWENLVQHYSWHRVVNVQPQHLFRKIVGGPGRGGYCMEANSFFHTILLSLGFDCYMAGARIYNQESKLYGGWTHCVNLVTIGGTKYLLDGGFGGNGPTHPVPLDHGAPATHVAPARCRVMYENLPQYVSRDSKVWVYQHQYDEAAPWVPMYCFTDLEFTPQDITAMNFAPWLNPRTFFTHKVVCVRFTTSAEIDGGDDEPESPGSPCESAIEGGELDGSLSLANDTLKWRRKGRKVLEIKLKTDVERVGALKKYFGVEFAAEDLESIAGSAAELSSRPFDLI